MISPQETARLFGPLNRPDYNTNLRHRAILRKSIELYSPEHLEAIFRHPLKLRVKTGSVSAAGQMGKIYTHYVQNDRLVSHETPIPDVEAQEELRAYCVGYDAYFMKKGNTYRIRNVYAKPAAQAAEQRWHDFMVRRGITAPRPDWALEPLPGLDRVRTIPANRPRPRRPAPVAPPTPPPSSPVRTIPANRPRPRPVAPPTPPPTSPVHHYAAPRPSSPAPLKKGSRQRPLDLSADDGPSALSRGRPQKKRHLGVIDISDDEEAQRPRKKLRFLGVVDLTV